MDRKTQKHVAIRENCRSHLASIVSEGLKPFPSCVFDLEVLLNAPVVDLQRVNGTLRWHDGFSRRILRLSNTILRRSNGYAPTVTDAVVFLGPCLFQTAVLLCAVTEFTGLESRDEGAEALWSHCVQMAILSEEISRQSEYPVPGAAYVAGLLHDIGYLPLRMVAREQQKTFDELSAIDWRDRIELERDIFGLDHCQIGHWMAKSWQFSESLIDAVRHHHDPSKAEKDPHLAEIVSAAEYHCSESSSKPKSPLAWQVPVPGSLQVVLH